MRHYLAIALTLAAVAGLAASELFNYLPVVACLLLLAGAWVRPGAGRLGHGLYAVVLLAALYGQYRYWDVPVDDVSHFTDHRLTLTGTVAELPSDAADRTTFLARAEAVTAGGRTVPVQGLVQVRRYGPWEGPPPAYGDRFTTPVTLRPPLSLRNPGGFDYAAQLWRGGVRARATAPRGAAFRTVPGPGGPLTAVHRWRQTIRALARQALPPGPAGLLTALAAGDARDVPDPVRAQFQGAGLAHLLAVSGTHLGLVAAGVFLLARWALRLLPGAWLARLTSRVSARQAAGVAALAAVTGYALLAGARTPTLRALVMVWMVMLALLLGRRAHAPTGLALAALGLVLWDPRAVGQASFQLSFAAVLAILLVAEGLRRPTAPGGGPPSLQARAGAALRGAAAVTLAAGLATAPLVAWHFGQVAWPGFLANLLLLPVTGAVVLPVALLAAIPAPALGTLPFPGAVGAVLGAFLKAVGAFAALPGALDPVPAPPLPLLLGTYGVALLVWADRRHDARRGAVIAACVLLPAWLVCLHPPPPTGMLRVTLLDVGQGDAAVAVGPDGEALVIDGGSRFGTFDAGRLAVGPYLEAIGARRVSLLATHPQVDHAGGLVALVPAFHPEAVYTNGDRNPKAAFTADLQGALATAGLTPAVLHRGSRISPLPGVGVRILNPPDGPAPAPGADLNDRSLVVRVAYGRHAFLFTADIEAPAERALLGSGEDLSATVLKVPHHGSATSSTGPFLDRVAPRLAVISVGRYNPYHHPSPAVEAAYRARGIDLRETSRTGAVLLASDGTTLRAATWADLAPARIPPWAPDPRAAEARNLERLLAPESLWRAVG